MDKQGIKKHWREFEAWINGKEVEFYNGEKFIPCVSPAWFEHQQYRVKPEPCKYPGLRKAIQERKEFFVKVTPEQSREVQEIAFACGVEWSFSGLQIENLSSDCMAFQHRPINQEYVMYSDKGNGETEFHLATDSFTAPLPEWVKSGQKAFYKDCLVTIKQYNPDLEYPVCVENDNGLQAWTAVSDLTPAKRQVTYEYLAKMMPFAVMERSNCKITTVLSVSADEVWIAGKGYTSFSLKKFCECYLLPDGSEIGEWVKWTP